MQPQTIVALLVLNSLFLAGCLQQPLQVGTTTPTTETRQQQTLEATGGQFKEIQVTNGVRHLIPLDEIRAGGPPKDGIPAIDNPKFSRADEVDYVPDDETILVLNYSGEVKAYPTHIMDWHEIVNDFAGGKPVLVTYCPLCDSGLAFERVVNAEAVEFGVSGKLYESNLLMYDRKTDSLWSQLSGVAVVGELAGLKLKLVPFYPARWGDWRKENPNALVLTRDTGFQRPYGERPYAPYFETENVLFPVSSDNKKLNAKEKIIGVELNGVFKAYSVNVIESKRVVEDKVGGVEIVISFNSTVKSVGIVNKADGSEIPFVSAFWFSWVAFHPDTLLYS